MSQPSAKKNWCGTLYDLPFEETFKSWGPDGALSLCTYMVWENEVCPSTGRKHLQFYMAFKKPYRLTALKKLHPTCKWIACDGTAAENRVYCTKNQRLGIPDTIVVELGNIDDVCGPRHSGGPDSGRKDLEAFKDAVKGGMLNMRELREEHTLVFAKYGAFVRSYVQDHQPTYQVDPHYLNSWQEALNQKLVAEPDDRRIIFVVDPKGNSGKTWFAKYYMALHPSNTQVMKSAKYLDMAYALECTSRHVFINCSRQQTEFLNYDFMESIKDGMVFSTKYEPINKKMNKCHVIVLMNQEPDQAKLTDDRYDILRVAEYKDVAASAERPAKRRRVNVERQAVPGTPPPAGLHDDFEPPVRSHEFSQDAVDFDLVDLPTLVYVPPVPEPGPEKPAPEIINVDSDSDTDSESDDSDSDSAPVTSHKDLSEANDEVSSGLTHDDSDCESVDLCASDAGAISLEDLAPCDSISEQEVASYELHLPTRSRLNAILNESDESDSDTESDGVPESTCYDSDSDSASVTSHKDLSEANDEVSSGLTHDDSDSEGEYEEDQFIEESDNEDDVIDLTME